MESSNFQVGSVVRTRRKQNPKSTGRAIVATLQDEKTACLLWEPIPPKPITIPTIGKNSKRSSPNNDIFWVSPSPTKEQREGEEIIVDMDEIQELQPFEKSSYVESSSPSADDNDCVSLWKDRGDQLLRLGDASSAVSYYEVALGKSSFISIGCTVVVQSKGFPKIAEVDCVEDESIDLTIVDSGYEATIHKSEILLGILEPDKEKLQERLLLNLARCMLQLSEIDTTNRPRYLKSAVLACSLVITISTFHDNEGQEPDDRNNNELSTNDQTALLLRAKAQGGLSKWPHAIADAKKLCKAGNEKGRKLLEGLERKKREQAKKDKRLSKEVCRWVQNATAESVSDNPESSSPTNPELPGVTAPAVPEARPQTKQSSTLSFLLSIVLPLVAAFLIQKVIFFEK